MVPQTQQRKPRNSSKVNLLISFVFHALIVLTAFYFAARGGLLGKQLKKIAVEMVKEKPKPPEKPKEPVKPKIETAKAQLPKEEPKAPPKVVEAPKTVTAPPPVSAPPAVAPPPAELPAFEFSGGKAVETSADPVTIYRGLLESVFRARWNPPEDLVDDNFVTEVQVAIGPDGRIGSPQLVKGSGNARWDKSVRQAVAAITSLDRPPPAKFPSHVLVRFDMQDQTEPLLAQ